MKRDYELLLIEQKLKDEMLLTYMISVDRLENENEQYQTNNKTLKECTTKFREKHEKFKIQMAESKADYEKSLSLYTQKYDSEYYKL